MIVVGVTGGLGTGKSTVSRILGGLGAVVIDADKIAHEAIQPKRLAWRRIIRAFGEQFLNDDETINRKKLGKLVFGDPQARKQLEDIVHPSAIRRIKQNLRRLARDRRVRVVVLDVPLLVETNQHSLVDILVVVTAPLEVVRVRLGKEGFSEAHIAERSKAQWDVSAKVALAECVIDNTDGLGQTRRQVRRLWNQLLETERKRRD